MTAAEHVAANPAYFGFWLFVLLVLQVDVLLIILAIRRWGPRG